MDELELVQAADQAGFKYVWVTEHHFLDEYSHLSANDVVLGYLAHATERIHIGSGIFNPLPQVNHPAKVAERVAMLDHLTERPLRVRHRPRRRQPRDPRLPPRHGRTCPAPREIWEDVIGEFAKMWLQDEYEGYEGKFWSLPPRKILPKPWGKPHPAMWYAAGNTSSYEMAARKGLGVLGFSVGDIDDARAGARRRTRTAIADAEPVGAFVNDNIMVTTAAFVDRGRRARRSQSALDSAMTYLQSNVFRYHDTFPHPPEVPHVAGADPRRHAEALDVPDRRRADLRRPRRRARAVPALGGGRRRPARVRRRHGDSRAARSRRSA